MLVANASLQWVPDHYDLLPHLVSLLALNGVLAIQMPDNWLEPTHVAMREVALEQQADLLAALGSPQVEDDRQALLQDAEAPKRIHRHRAGINRNMRERQPSAGRRRGPRKP